MRLATGVVERVRAISTWSVGLASLVPSFRTRVRRGWRWRTHHLGWRQIAGGARKFSVASEMIHCLYRTIISLLYYIGLICSSRVSSNGIYLQSRLHLTLFFTSCASSIVVLILFYISFHVRIICLLRIPCFLLGDLSCILQRWLGSSGYTSGV